MKFREALGKQLLFTDGALGTLLQDAGLAPGEAPILWNLTNPDAVRSIHRTYLEAGATIITTNTFSAGALMLAGETAKAIEAVVAGVTLVREAIEQQGGHGEQGDQSNTAYVALNIGPLGQMLAPLGEVEFEEAIEAFTKQIKAGAEAGADLVLIETMFDTNELRAAVLAAQEACELPILASVALDERGRMLNGADSACVCALLNGLGIDAIGMNCGGGPVEAAPFIQTFSEYSSLPLILNPNAGLPITEGAKTRYPVGPEEFAELMKPLVKEYVAVAGGCCGTTPAHIKALTAKCNTIQPKTPTPRKRIMVSSFAKAVDLVAGEVQIDYRIDPVNNPKLGAALSKGEFDFALDEALEARDDEAQIISVSAQQPGINEEEALPAMVKEIQSMVNVPLLINTASLPALARVLRIYNGCALVSLASLPPNQREEARAL
ncbi:MAG: homocysteine S-methyltransferase family protein, partial [Coriobacteriia bacterium]|nr:homocysteine S-methyltransferase family protein [Coriobacteriia bacterium]